LSDSVEESILATQEKILENENHLEKLKSLQNEVTEDINNDLKKIQEQIFDVSFY
jgi:cob(I)alamin adenosyltransferase